MLEQEQMSVPWRVSGNEPSLLDLWKVIVRYKWLVAGLPAAAIFLSIASVKLLGSQWEAAALIRIGQVGQVGQFVQPFRYVEPISNTVERIRQQSFVDAVLYAVGDN